MTITSSSNGSPQQGYIVWVCDPYSASGEGAVSAWHAHQQLGVTELADLEESLRWLAAHENADLTRVGIVGHSYGGYMAAYALTHSRMFKLGIAGSALTDWRNYDSVYAERLMRTPEHNPEGYAAAVGGGRGGKSARPVTAGSRGDGRQRTPAESHAVHPRGPGRRTRTST